MTKATSTPDAPEGDAPSLAGLASVIKDMGKIIDRTLVEVERLAGEVKSLFDRYDVDPSEIETLNALAEHLSRLQQDATLAAFYEAPLAARVHDLEQIALVGSARTAATLYARSQLASDYEPRTFAEELENIFEQLGGDSMTTPAKERPLERVVASTIE